MNQSELLSSVKEIIGRYREENRKSGIEFNIFDVTTVNYHEVMMCKVIAEFIDPTGSHGQGDNYLQLFFRDVLNMEYKESYRSCEVQKEYRIDKDRRIDIVISSRELFIPIEVKIYAGDQKRQCYDYLVEAKRYGSGVLYYLTRFGDEPSKESYVDEECLSKVKTVSFIGNIRKWLESCIAVTPQDNLRIILRQLKTAVEELTDTYVGAGEMEIMELINSPENIGAALKIAASLNDIKAQKIKDVFEALKTKLESNTELSKKIDSKYDYSKRYTDFEKGCRFLQLCYKLDKFEILNEEYFIVLVMEIGNSNNESGVFQYGTRVCKKSNTSEQIKIPDNLPDNIKNRYMKIIDKNNDWLYLNRFMYNDLYFNFRKYNEAYTKLYDSERFDEIIFGFANQIISEYFDKNGKILPNV